VKPIREISGEVRLPGSKSLSNRALLLAALADGVTVVENLLVRLRRPSHARSAAAPAVSAGLLQAMGG